MIPQLAPMYWIMSLGFCVLVILAVSLMGFVSGAQISGSGCYKGKGILWW